ncbi:NAD(P)-binding protein [Massarina eburnea CBS 473.64]|uniref:NAD(P)-binding protein n=1 Tax=Massarina eburnea CBS 473.64 TaxID=1395130 RepID=A0A6A6SGT4_9PLEO|nr:NAD(P)-binding protein [Massarina eburnea CBS 473.64]
MIFSILSNGGLAIIGIYVFYQIYRFYAFYFRIPATPLQAYKRKEGASWALISGSSGGIGYATAHHLLSLGFGVIIFAHEEILQAEARLRKDFPNGNIKAFSFNCMTASISDIENLVQQVKSLTITILVNNVGSIPQTHPAMRPFADFDPTTGIDDTISLNAGFMTHLTRLMVPYLKANASPRSLILNLSSASYVGLPYMALYSATKAYIIGLSVSNNREFRVLGIPIDVLAIVPGDVHSMNNRLGVTPGSPSAIQFAGHVVGRVDEAVRREMSVVVPYWKHALEMAILEWLPESVRVREMTKVVVGKRDAWAREYKTL